MQRTASEEARTSEEIVIEDPPVKYVEEPLHKPRKSIKKIDSAKLFTVEKQKHITSSNLKDKKILDFKNFGKSNAVQTKTINFMTSNQSLASNFKESKSDLNEILKKFANRNKSDDYFELIKLGMNDNEILLGEYLFEKSESTEYVLGSDIIPGFIILTNYRLIFLPKVDAIFNNYKLQKSFFLIPYMFIDKTSKFQDKKPNFCHHILDIYTKDYRELRFRFQFSTGPDKISQSLYSFYLPKFREIYAMQFFHFLNSLEEENGGWSLYDIRREYKRQGIEEDNKFVRFVDNSAGKVCSTYPALLLVPRGFSDEFIIKVANFRSRERLPVLTYAFSFRFGNKEIKSFLWRSSQCKPGITEQRSIEDENYLKQLAEKLNDFISFSNLKIYDARPFLNAVANKVNGKGYENICFYRQTEIKFLGIHNIQKVREAYRKVLHGCYNFDHKFKWLSHLENSNWLDFIFDILQGTMEIVDSLKKGHNCLIHCSDGWDRTSQLLSLTQIMLDPYFRTLEGFMVLVEKEWISFGHQFALRCGHGNNLIDDQKSPIFIQFLDCVHQLMHQFPLSFEYNMTFLLEVAVNVYSCLYGNFLYDSYQEKKLVNIEERTISLWSYILANQEKFRNPFYKNPEETGIREIFPSLSFKVLRFWKEYYLRFLNESKDKYKIATYTEDCLAINYSLAVKEKTLLKEELKKLKKERERENMPKTDKNDDIQN